MLALSIKSHKAYLAGHIRDEVAEIDNLSVDVDDVRPVPLGDDGSSARRDSCRRFHQSLYSKRSVVSRRCKR